MVNLFLKLLNMSITAGWIVLAVLTLRLLLKKAPKWLMCLLWAAVAVRLVLPFSIESMISMIPSGETVPQNIVIADTPMINSGVPIINSTINPIISDMSTPVVLQGESVNPMQIAATAASIVWIFGMVAMGIYALISYLRIYRKVRISMPYEDNIYICDAIDSPFILGILRPKIYLPSTLDAMQYAHVIAHEKAHIQRRDHFWKPFGFALLSLYWFHPLLWVGYILLCRDLEGACDEKVVKDMSMQEKAAYSETLLACSVTHRMISACPVAFGETGVKSRIKSVLHYQKPAFWVIILAVVACTVLAVCFLTDPVKDKENATDTGRHNDDVLNESPEASLKALREVFEKQGVSLPENYNFPDAEKTEQVCEGMTAEAVEELLGAAYGHIVYGSGITYDWLYYVDTEAKICIVQLSNQVVTSVLFVSTDEIVTPFPEAEPQTGDPNKVLAHWKTIAPDGYTGRTDFPDAQTVRSISVDELEAYIPQLGQEHFRQRLFRNDYNSELYYWYILSDGSVLSLATNAKKGHIISYQDAILRNDLFNSTTFTCVFACVTTIGNDYFYAYDRREPSRKFKILYDDASLLKKGTELCVGYQEEKVLDDGILQITAMHLQYTKIEREEAEIIKVGMSYDLLEKYSTGIWPLQSTSSTLPPYHMVTFDIVRSEHVSYFSIEGGGKLTVKSKYTGTLGNMQRIITEVKITD